MSHNETTIKDFYLMRCIFSRQCIWSLHRA
ncbi:hypothetical protein VPHPS32B8_0077 [Vibrio phage PS32B-8]